MNRIYSHPTIVSTETGGLQLGGTIIRKDNAERELQATLRWGDDLFDEDAGDLPPVADLLIVDQRSNFEGDLPAALGSTLRQLDQRNEPGQSLMIEQTTQWGQDPTRLVRVYGHRSPRRWSATDDIEHVVMMESRDPSHVVGATRALKRNARKIDGGNHILLATSTADVDGENWSWLTIAAPVGILRQLPRPRFGFPLVGDHGEVEVTLSDKAATVATRNMMALTLEMDGAQAAQLLMLEGWKQGDKNIVWTHPNKPRLSAVIESTANETACRIKFDTQTVARAS